MRTSLVLLSLMSLAACGSEDVGDTKRGADVTIDAKSKDGDAVAIAADGGTGKVSVKLPGFEGKIDLPKIPTDASHFDIDGVELYPGSQITKFAVSANEHHGGDDAKVNVSFTAPASPEAVAAHFRAAFSKEDIAISENEGVLSGKTRDGNAFSVTLKPGANGQTVGGIGIAGGN